MGHTYREGDEVIIRRHGRLNGRAGEIVSVSRSEECASLDILHVDIGNMHVPCLPEQVRGNENTN